MNHKYQIYTTVDITPTGVINNTNKSHSQEHEHRRNQQRNYDTICQVISLRANIYYPEVTIFVQTNKRPGFKSNTVFLNPNLPEQFLIWRLAFLCDREQAFGENFSALLEDLHGVPIIPALDETVPQFPPYFISYGDLKNVHAVYDDLNW
jgi:hypothetical protein